MGTPWSINSGFRAHKPCKQFRIFGHGLAGGRTGCKLCWLKTQRQQQQNTQEDKDRQSLPESLCAAPWLNGLTQTNTVRMTTTSSNSNSSVRKLDITVLMLRKWPMIVPTSSNQSETPNAVDPCRPHLILESLQSHWIKERLRRDQRHLKNDETPTSLSNGRVLVEIYI